MFERNRSAYLKEDTIAAVCSALGGAISVLRISGPQALEFSSRLVLKGEQKEFEPWKIYRHRLVNSEQKNIDDAMMAYFKAPKSFTGEDVVEFYLHGSPLIAAEVLQSLESFGARQALPGEFSFRAVKNGKMTLFQAQALPDLISSQNENALELALEKLTGQQTSWIQKLSEDLKSLCMWGEVGIDFSDQSIDELELPSLKAKLEPLRQTLQKLKESFQRGRRIQEGISVVLAGLPNAGKSSFFNSLLGEDRSIVSEIPGTTRDEVREKFTFQNQKNTVTFLLSDTAGLRESNDQIEKEGVQRAQKKVQGAELVLLIVDPNQSFDELKNLWSSIGKPKDKTLVIFTKSDLGKTDTGKILEFLDCPEFVITSSKEGQGISEAAQKMVGLVAPLVGKKRGELILTREDHYHAVEKALEHLDRAKAAPELDLFASDIRQALFSLDVLIGETVSDDILGKIFSEFCIGK